MKRLKPTTRLVHRETGATFIVTRVMRGRLEDLTVGRVYEVAPVVGLTPRQVMTPTQVEVKFTHKEDA